MPYFPLLAAKLFILTPEWAIIYERSHLFEVSVGKEYF